MGRKEHGGISDKKSKGLVQHAEEAGHLLEGRTGKEVEAARGKEKKGRS